MAKSSSWISHIETFVDLSRTPSEQTASRDAIASLIKDDILTMEALVKEMGLYLTSTDHAIRGRGILLLAELLTSLATKTFEYRTVHSLVVFFTEKLADWQALHGTLVACLALLRRKSNVGMVTSSDARSLAHSFLRNVQVQVLGKQDRKLCFTIFDNLLNQHPDVVVPLAVDLIDGILEAIDGEKDPECLMLTFRLVPDLVRHFPDPFGTLAGVSEDLFDILGRYFPVHFTHPSDDFVVKREDLSKALMLAFASTPLFEPFAIPILLEKLSSSLPLAKVDSLKYLRNCSVKYGADIMAKLAKAIWCSLKRAIFSSLEEPMLARFSESSDDLDFPPNDVAKEALLCVQEFILQEDGLFLGLILEDEEVEEILRSTTSIGSYSDISLDNRTKLYSLGCILSASATVSIACCDKIFQHFFPRLMEILGFSEKSFAQTHISDDCSVTSENLNYGALYLCVELLVAGRGLALSFKESLLGSISGEKSWCCLLKKFSAPLAEVFRIMLVTSQTQDPHEAEVHCGVKGLRILATYPGCFVPKSESTFEKILTMFTSIVASRRGGTLLWKLTLKALSEIGAFIEKFHDSEKISSYTTIVVEKVVSLVCVDNSVLPLPLLLEAISGIGTSGQNFMLRVTRGLEDAISTNFLEACVKGNSKSVLTLVPLLECYSSKVLPWYNKHGDFEDVALRFSDSIWNEIECNNTFNIGVEGKELLDRTMTALKLAVAGCSESNQGLIVQKAYNVLSSSTFFRSKEAFLFSISTKSEEIQLIQGLNILSSRDEWIICLFASVIIALRPQTPFQNLRVVLNLFTSLLLKGYVPVAQGLGSIINKLPLKKSIVDVTAECNLEEAMDMVLQMGLCSNSLKKCGIVNGDGKDLLISLDVGDCDLVQSNAIAGLAWIGKGLLMRGNERVKDVIVLILGCLLSSSKLRTSLPEQDIMQDSGEQIMHPLVKRSAADAFHVLLSDSDVCLNKGFHAMMKPLYKQHFFSTMKPILLNLIKESESSTTRCMLYRALGHVISNTPLAAVVIEAKTLISVVLDGLSLLSVDPRDRDLTYSLLLVLSAIIMDENGREAIIENAHIVIDCLIGLVSYSHMMLVRETAIQCLVAMSGLPHTRIYPMRTKVLERISKSLDDPKRNVRYEAIRCRQAWASIA